MKYEEAIIVSKYLPPKESLLIKRKLIILESRYLADLSKEVINVNNTNNKTYWHHVSPARMHYEGHNTMSVLSLHQMHNINIIIRNH